MVDPSLTVGLVHDTLRVPSDGVGSTDILSGTGATVCEKGNMLDKYRYANYTMKMILYE